MDDQFIMRVIPSRKWVTLKFRSNPTFRPLSFEY